MPILASTTYVNAYGKSSVVALEARNLESMAGTQDVFVVKYSTLGKALWSARVGSPAGEEAYGIATDSSGNVYLTGSSQGTIVSAFNSDGTTFGRVSRTGGVYIVKYNTSGFVQWITSFDGVNSEVGNAISTDSTGNVYVAGQFGGLATAYNSDGTAFGTTLANSGGWDAFILKYNTNGFVQWVARVATATGSEIAYGISTDSSGNVYVTGDGGSAVDVTAFNSDGTSFATTLANSGGTDAFIVKYDTNGFVQWVARIGSPGGDIGFGIASDSSGNVYVIGYFIGIATAFNSDGTSFATTLANSGNNDAFVIKYNTNGFVQWVARIGSSQFEIGRAIATDSSGNVYVSGDFSGTTTAFSSNGTAFGTTLPVSGVNDVFVVKYDTSGIVQWVARVGSTAQDLGYGMDVDSIGNVYISGLGGSNAVVTAFNSNGTAFGTTIPSSGSSDAYVVKYNTSGSVQWVTRLSSSATDSGRGVSVDTAGNMYITGWYTGSYFSIYGQAVSLFSTLPSSGGTDGFIIKYNTNGATQWAARVASTGADMIQSIISDSSGNVYVTGQGGPGAVVTAFNSDGTSFATTLANSGNNDVFIVKYNTNGFVQWVARIASTGGDFGFGIASDSSGNVYVTGQGGSGGVVVTAFNSDGTSFATTLANSGGTDAFVVKYDTNGFVQWVARIASTGNDIGYKIASDSSGNVYVTGQGGSAAVVTAFNSDGTAFATTLANSGGTDAFIVKYNTSGFVQWVAGVASTGADIGYAVATDSSGNVYVTGQGGSGAVVTAFNSDGTSFATTLANSGGTDTFIVKYDTNGFVQWVARIASTAGDIGFGIASDSSGNVYVTGQGGSAAVVTAFNSDGTAFGITLANAGSLDAFIVKYNTNGFVQWVTRIAGVNGDRGYGITTDSSGNVYVTGNTDTFGSTFNVFNQNNEIFATVTGTIFTVKYDTNGYAKWVQALRQSNNFPDSRSICVDGFGNAYISGIAPSTASLIIMNHDLTPYRVLNTSGGADAYIVKYSSNTTPLWVAKIGSTAGDLGYGIATDSSGNVYVTGEYGSGGVTAFNSDGTPFATTLANSGGTDTFIVKYNTNGFVQWFTRVAGGGTDRGHTISTDSSGNVYITGIYLGTLTAFGANGVAFGTTITASGVGDAFVVKYDTNGSVQWLANVSSSGSDFGFGIASDSSGNVYVTGQGGSGAVVTAFNSDGTSFATTLANAGNADAFIVKYNTSGFVQWVARIASTGNDIGYKITTDSSGNVYVTGQGGSGAVVTAFNSDGTSFATTLANSGGTDTFIVKYDTNGFVQWVTRIASAGDDIGFGIASDSSGNVYVTGQGASATVSAFNSDGTAFGTTLANQGAGDAFIVKYNTGGTVQWVARIASNNQDISYAITTDSSGSVYVSGSYNGGQLSSYNSNGTIFGSLGQSTVGLGIETFMIKYDTNGNVQWMSGLGGRGTDDSRAIALDSSNNIYITGQFNTSALIPYSV